MQQAEALYRSLFVTFDSRPASELVYSPLGMIPRNWRIVTLGEVTSNVRKRVRDNCYRVLSAVNSGILQPSDEHFTKQVFSKDISSYIVVEENDFAYNPSRVNIGSIGINDLGYTGCVSPVYVVFRVEPSYQNFFRFFIRSKRFKEEVILRSSGSVRQSMNYSDFSQISVAYPDKGTIAAFNDAYNHIHSVIQHVKQESETLVGIRDTLLPRLISGEIDVSSVTI